MKFIKTILCLFLFNIVSYGQTDISGSSDSDLISRYPDSWIVQYSTNEYDQYTVPLSKEKGGAPGEMLKDIKVIEGRRTIKFLHQD